MALIVNPLKAPLYQFYLMRCVLWTWKQGGFIDNCNPNILYFKYGVTKLVNRRGLTPFCLICQVQQTLTLIWPWAWGYYGEYEYANNEFCVADILTWCHEPFVLFESVRCWPYINELRIRSFAFGAFLVPHVKQTSY